MAFRQFPTLNDVPETSQTLYTILFEPVRAYIQTSAIYIAPHNILHYLPFGALHDGQHFLVENYTIAYTPSASVMAYLKSQRSTQDSMRGQEFQALVLGDPAYQTQELPALPYAKPEAESVVAILGTNVHLGADATEKLLVEEGQRANYIHIVAHGELNPSAPQFSRVCLASSPSEQKESSDQSTFSSLDALDGSLNVWEIWNLPLENVELVTLSACETQLGEVSAGDDIVGLNRAFLHAGARSLIASLWKVEDQSTEFLMTRLYTYLNDGKGEAEALRLAQLDTLETYPSPYYWAPFTLVGDIGEIAETQPPLPWGWIVGGVVLVVLLGIARYLHKHH
jgi:CHAT domain-containing protein